MSCCSYKRILYVGTLMTGGTCLSRMNGLKRLGLKVIPVDTDLHIFSKYRWVRGIHNRLLIGPGIHSLNKERKKNLTHTEVDELKK